MSDGTIRIIIGASMDRSVETVFGNIEKRAQKAAQTISKSFSGGSSGDGVGKGAARGFESAAAAAKKAERDIEREIARQNKVVDSASREQVKFHERAARARVRAEEQASREIIQNFKRITSERKKELADQERAEKRASASSMPVRFGRHLGMYATNNLVPGSLNPMGTISRFGNDLLRGAGVDLSLSGTVARSVQMQSGSVQLANQERIATGTTRGAGQWNATSRMIGDKFSAEASNVQDMILAMTAKTGDFKNAAAIAEPLTGLGIASGANLRDMGNAAGYVYNQLSKLPDAGERTIEVMRGIVGQTAVGAVDMPDYAVQLGRIAANASKFAGPVSDNIRKMSALAQLAVESGGASSPADAARSVAAFANTFGKHARIEAFEKHGVELFTVSNEQKRKNPALAQDTLRDPFEIIKDSFRKTKGDIPALSIMFADTLGRKPVQALANAYKAAGGGKKGIAAIEGQFGKYMNTILDEKVEKQNLKDYEDSTAAKAIKFQNNLDMVATSAAERVFPALEKLAPMALSAADSLGSFAGWAAENPMSGVSALIGASIANAGIQAAVRTSVEKAFSSGLTTISPGSVTIAGGAVLLATSVMLEQANGLAKMVGSKENADDLLPGFKNGKFSMDNLFEDILNPINMAKRRGKVLGDIGYKTWDAIAHQDGSIDEKSGFRRGALSQEDYALMHPRIAQPFRADRYDPAQRSSELQEGVMQMADQIRLMRSGIAGILQVEVVNPQDIGKDAGPRVDGNGRQPSGLPAKWFGPQ